MQALELQQLQLRSNRSGWVDDQPADSTSVAERVSRATEIGFQQEDQIGVFIHRSPSITPQDIHSSNMPYVMSSSGQWSPSVPLKDPLTANEYWVTAYYPYDADLTDDMIVEHSVGLNQSAPASTMATTLERSDFCMTTLAATLDALQSESPRADLVFSHLMSKVQLDIDVPEMIDKSKVNKLERVVLCNLYASCQINLQDQSIKLTRVGNNRISPRLVDGFGTPGLVSTYEAIVVPQPLTSGVVFVEMYFVMMDGSSKMLEYKILDEQNFRLLKGQKTILSLSGTGQLSFLNELDLLDGLAKNDLVLEIKAPKGKEWNLISSTSWLRFSLLPSTESGANYGTTVSGVGTGSKQTVYVKVEPNLQKTMAINNIRASILTLKSKINATDLSVHYTATQNYAAFEPVVSELSAAQTQHAEAGEVFMTNYYWHAVSDQTWLKFATSDQYGQGEPQVRYPAYAGSVAGALQTGKMWYQFAANPASSERRAIVTFVSYYDGKEGQPYKTTTRTVVQRGSSLEGQNPPNLPAVVGTTKLTFTTTPSLHWSIQGIPDWVSDYRPISGVVGASGVVEVIITGKVNSGVIPHKQNITVTAGDMTLPLVLTQSGGDFNLDQTASNLVASANSTLGFKVENTLGGSWTVESIKDKSGAAVNWLTVSPMSGTGLGPVVGAPITVTSQVNNTDAPRVAVVAVKAGTTVLTVEFTQRAPALSNFTHSLTDFTLPYPALWASGDLMVTPINDPLLLALGGLQWKMSSSDPVNLTVSHTAAQTLMANTVRVSALANNTNTERTLSYYLNYGALSGGLKSAFNVKQAPPAFNVSVNKEVGPHKTSDSFLLSTTSNHEGVKYSLSGSSNVTSLNPAAGTYTVVGTSSVSQSVTLGFTQNTGAQRTHTVTVGYGTSLSKVYTVTQQAVSLTLAPSSISIGADGGSVSSTVTTNTPYTAAVTSIYGGSVSPSSGATPPYSARSTTFTVPAQLAVPTPPRIHTFVFTPSPDYTGYSQVKTFTVTQDSRPVTFSFSAYNPGVTIPKGGATYFFNITANTSWKLVSNSSYVTVTPTSGTGNYANVRVTVAATSASSSRTASLGFVSTANVAGVSELTRTWSGTQESGVPAGCFPTPLPGISPTVYMSTSIASFATDISSARAACRPPWRLPTYNELATIYNYKHLYGNPEYVHFFYDNGGSDYGRRFMYNWGGLTSNWGTEVRCVQ